MRRVLCVHMPDLATERVRRDELPRSDEAGRPLVLTRRAGGSLIVARVCRRAGRLGLRPGMTLGQARAIVPDLLAHPHEPQRDRALLNRLAGWALRFSPSVAPRAPDTLLLDITGCARLFGGEGEIARQAVGGLLRQGFSARAAISDSVGAAYALATAASEPLVVVPAGRGGAALAGLPPAALRLEPRSVERLAALGVRTVADLLRLPRATLPARFGAQAVWRLRQALGESFEGLGAREPAAPARARISFDAPVRELAQLESVAERLLGKVFARLWQRGRALRRIECVVYYERRAPAVISIGLSRAARARGHVGQLLRERLAGIDLGPGVCGLGLVARETVRWRGGQGELFAPCDPGHQEELGCLLDRLANRLGPRAVRRASLVDDHQPEEAFRYAGLTEHAGRRGPAPAGAGRRPCPARAARPVRLLPRPAGIRVIALLPDGPPSWMLYRGREHVLIHASGPERIETGWWRGPDVRRDYFRVTSRTGEQFWIFCTRPDHDWFLHGIFA